MIAAQRCPQCGSPVSDNVAQGECVRCLLQLAIETNPATKTLAGPFDAPTAAALDRLLPDFDVLDVLGQGGMGTVYKAWQKKLDRTVAIKVLPPQLAKDTALAQRFVREAKALAQLHHPHVVTAFDVGEVQGMPYLVMEFVDGVDLASYVHDAGPIDPAQAARWIMQAAEGLDFAHRKGIIHRDIKPGNLLVDQDGQLKILDLGLARFEQEAAGGMQNAPLTQSGHLMGTVAFMSPEQALDTHHADARSDIYSLGCTLYFLLTGRGLFAENTLVKTILAHRDQAVPWLCDERTDMPPDLDAVFRKMVAKSPDGRQRSMAEVCVELRACLDRLAANSPLASAGNRLSPAYQATASALERTVTFPRPESLSVAGTEVPAAIAGHDANNPAAARRRVSFTRRLLTTAAIGLLFVFGVIVYQIQTDRGTMILNIDEASESQIETMLNDGGLVLLDKEKGASWVVKPQQRKSAPSGTYQLQPVDGLLLTVSNDAGVELKTDEFKLKRGDKVVVRVSLLASRVTALPGTKTPDKPTPAAAAIAEAKGLDPAAEGLTIHDPQWKLAQVLRPGRPYSTRFDRQGRLWFSMPQRSGDEQSLPPGIYRQQPDGTPVAVARNEYWEFALSPDEQRCFAHRGTLGVIAEINLQDGSTVREIDMSPSDDGPTSPFFAPSWYRGALLLPNEYLFADFGGRKRGPPSTGGIWKFGSQIETQPLFTMPDGESRLHALAFGRDQVFVASTNGKAGRLATYDGQTLTDLATETLPVIGSLAFDPSDGSLLASEFDGRQLLRIDLSRTDQPATVKPILSGFRQLNFGVLTLSPDGRQLAVVDFDAGAIFLLERAVQQPVGKWTKPERLWPNRDAEGIDCAPTLSADGNSLVFFSSRSGRPALWESRRDANDQPFPVPSPINAPGLSDVKTIWDPCLTADGLTLYFLANQSAAESRVELLAVRRGTLQQPWGKVEAVGESLNILEPHWAMRLSADRRVLVFASGRAGGLGESDLWLRRRESADEPFAEPVNLGRGINSADSEVVFALAADSCTLFFLRGNKPPQLYMATRSNTNESFLPTVAVEFGSDDLLGAYPAGMSGDGRTLLFTSATKEEPEQLWMTRRVLPSATATPLDEK